MRNSILFAAFVLTVGNANAQQPPPFVPFTVDQKSYESAIIYLRQQPYMFARPMIDWLEAAEANARTLAAKAEQEAKEKAAKEKIEAPEAPK